jgi:hypothetical protein
MQTVPMRHPVAIAAVVVALILAGCDARKPASPTGDDAQSAATADAAAADATPRAQEPPPRGQWSNINGGIGYGLQLDRDRGRLVECETGGYCSVYPVEDVRWGETELGLTVRYPGEAQAWKADYGPDGMLRITGGIWRAQTLFDCERASAAERAPPYLCPDPLPLPDGPPGERPPADRPAPEYDGRLKPGPQAPDWRAVASWPEGVAGILWGQEANGADPCAPVLEPPPGAEHGWSRFWTWRVFARDALTEYTILHRILVWGGKTSSELSVVQRRSLSVWRAGSPGFASTFMTYSPSAPRDIHSRFDIHTLSPQGEGRRALQSRGLIDRLGEEVDFTYALTRHRDGSPLQPSEHGEVGIGPPEGTETACRPEELGVLASLRYRMRDVSRGTDSYGRMGDLLDRLTGP